MRIGRRADSDYAREVQNDVSNRTPQDGTSHLSKGWMIISYIIPAIIAISIILYIIQVIYLKRKHDKLQKEYDQYKLSKKKPKVEYKEVTGKKREVSSQVKEPNKVKSDAVSSKLDDNSNVKVTEGVNENSTTLDGIKKQGKSGSVRTEEDKSTKDEPKTNEKVNGGEIKSNSTINNDKDKIKLDD